MGTKEIEMSFWDATERRGRNEKEFGTALTLRHLPQPFQIPTIEPVRLLLDPILLGKHLVQFLLRWEASLSSSLSQHHLLLLLSVPAGEGRHENDEAFDWWETLENLFSQEGRDEKVVSSQERDGVKGAFELTSIRSSIQRFLSTNAWSSMTSVSPSASEGDSGGRHIWEGTGEEMVLVGRRKAAEERSREGGRCWRGGRSGGCFSARPTRKTACHLFIGL